MKAAEFEEKEYETALYAQLIRADARLWAPGQVLESYLGFDGALLINDLYLWELHGWRSPLRGVSPYNSLWRMLRRRHWQRNRLPRFRFNCFVQTKRPHVGSRLPKKLASLGSARPFFRFSIDTDQQRTLEAAAKILNGRALFTYATPVFATSRQLFHHMRFGSLTTHSTFPEIGALAGQHAWYYNQPGAVGVANRSFEPLRMLSLDARVTRLVEEHRNETEEAQSPSAALADLLRELQAIVAAPENIEDSGQARAAYLADEWRRISAFAEEVDAPPALFSFLGVDAFARYFNLLWITIA